MVLIVADVLAYAIITGFEKIGWQAVLALCFVAVAVETADVFFSIKGSPRFGPSKQSVVISLAGCCLFALLLTPSLLIIGLVGGFFLGGVLGMLCSLMIEEWKLKPSYRMPVSVLIGRTSTLFAKGSVATTLVYFTLLSSYN
jgi:uncharacterized protein YqgC (DUF456 family)